MAERRTEQMMGTAITIEITDGVVPAGAITRAFAWLRWVDETFSPYRPDSEISRLGSGRLALADAHPLVRSVLDECEALRVATGGYFDVRAGGRGGIDPSGLVKGWAVDRAFAGLRRAGARRLSVEAGGDVRVGGGGWRVGVRHPESPSRCAAVLLVDDGAVATSGTYERGGHVRDPHARAPAAGAVSVTLVDRTLARADAYATAALAMGSLGPVWTANSATMTILEDAQVLVTPAFDALRVL